MSFQNADLPKRMGDSSIEDSIVFLIAILLLVIVAAVIFFGNDWLLPPVVPSPRL